MGSRMVWWKGDGGGGGGGVESGAVLGQVSTLASGVLRDPHEVPQPDKVVFVPVVQIVQVPQKLVVEVVEIPQLQLIENIAAIPVSVVSSRRKLWKFRSCSSSTRSLSSLSLRRG